MIIPIGYTPETKNLPLPVNITGIIVPEIPRMSLLASLIFEWFV